MNKLKSSYKTESIGTRRMVLAALMLILSCEDLTAQLHSVKQDGTGDFTVIQAAINSCQDGDTVLVWPGIYYENLNFNGKNIVLGSLNLTTNDPSYIRETVIDGNYSESCIKVISGEVVEVIGFKITHGSGDTEFLERGDGGGIFTYGSEISVINCLITENNVSGAGGGIFNGITRLSLSGTTICFNHAKRAAGGLMADNHSSLLSFDSVNRCNIYMNFAGQGCDIYCPNYDAPLRLFVDTFTVLSPDRYHIEIYHDLLPDSNFIFDARHAKLDTADADLYVDPSGSDQNNGLTPDQPLRTLATALAMIVTTPGINRKIYLANGIYSKATNGEKLPINIRSYVDIVGTAMDSTVFDADSVTYFFKGNEMIRDYKIKNLTLLSGYGYETASPAGSIGLVMNYNATFENITALHSTAHMTGCMRINVSNNIFLKNVNILNTVGGFEALHIGNVPVTGAPFERDTIWLINCRINNSMPSPLGVWYGDGGAISIYYAEESNKDTMITVNIIGCEIAHNTVNSMGGGGISGIVFEHGGTEVNLINSTIVDNNPYSGNNGCAIGFDGYGHLNVYNSIIYQNCPPQIAFGNSSNPFDTCELKIYNSLVDNGQQGILSLSPNNIFYYDPSNLDSDPLWDTASIYPYSLSEGSPCIDAGTLDIPSWIQLPEYDIAGNPRVWGDNIDMGAYEYGPWVKLPETPNSKFKIQNLKLLSVSPNPLSYGTYVKYELRVAGRVNISVFSTSGMKIKTLADFTGSMGDRGDIYWDCIDGNGHEVPDGSYIIRMTVDSKLVESVKIIKIR